MQPMFSGALILEITRAGTMTHRTWARVAVPGTAYTQRGYHRAYVRRRYTASGGT